MAPGLIRDNSADAAAERLCKTDRAKRNQKKTNQQSVIACSLP